MPDLAEPTIKDIFDRMTPEQKDLAYLIFGAAAEGDVSFDDDDMFSIYNLMSPDQKNVINFIVGSILDDDDTIEHTDENGQTFFSMTEYLEHHGVKGQKWGVRKDGTSGAGGTGRPSDQTRKVIKAAKGRVKAGSGTLGDVHVAAIRTKGQKVLDAVFGDKTYWKRQAAILGVAALGVGASFAVPALLPATTLASIAQLSGANIVAGHILTSSGTIVSASSVGAQIATQVGLTATYVGARVSSGVNRVTSVARVLTANSKINANYASLGKHMADKQNTGNAYTNKLLTQNYGVSKRSLKQSDESDSMTFSEFLAQSDETDSMSGEMTFSYYLEHHGIKGQKWGIRRVLNRLSNQRGHGGVDAKGSSESEGSSGSGHSSGSKADPKKGVGHNSNEDNFLSADAERFLATRKKDLHEMSTADMKAAVARAKAIDEYNAFFKQDPLKAQVDHIKLQKEYNEYHAKVHPSTLSKIAGASVVAFNVYTTLNKGAGGKIGNFLATRVGLNKKSREDILKAENDMLRLLSENRKAKELLNRQIAARLGEQRTDPTPGPDPRVHGSRPPTPSNRYPDPNSAGPGIGNG